MSPRYQQWLEKDPDPKTRAELEDLIATDNQAELQDRFGGRLAFGTAGLRGVMGAGPNRMNRLVIRQTSAGLGTYLLDTVPEAADRGVVVGFDGRKGSRIFAEDAAAVLCGLGIKVRLFDREVPTPVCAFAVTQLHAAAGVMVTASHNPPEYNGYKVYWSNGAQIIPPHDSGIADAIEQAARTSLPWIEPAGAKAQGLLKSIDDGLWNTYHQAVAELSLHRPRGNRAGFGIAYTPLHGVGARSAEEALKRAGFTDVATVPEQREPDGEFPTVRFPNPEEDGAMDAVLALAEARGARLAIANDPDADRLAVAVRRGPGDYQMLTGDQIGTLLGYDRILNARGKRRCVATTIVSSRLLGRMAQAHDVGYFETLTGFKWIANGAITRGKQGETFLLGYEEALGYTIGELVRDKDGISALVAFCEFAADCEARGTDVLNVLAEIYGRHGLFLTHQKSLQLNPDSPPVGQLLRQRGITEIAGRAVTRCDDLLDPDNARRLPTSDVLIYTLADDSRVIVRPSGTEPKLKCYYEIVHPVGDAGADAAMAEAQRSLFDLRDRHQSELSTLG